MDNLHALGKKTEYSMDYDPQVLEWFENKHPENDYFIKFNCPEYRAAGFRHHLYFLRSGPEDG